MPPVLVHLVRHGQSTWNAEGRLQGQTHDVPLTSLGRTQAARAAEVLARLVADSPRIGLWSSDQIRARQTADIIAARLSLPVLHEPALREQTLGKMEGRLTSELRAEPTHEELRIDEMSWGGGESLQMVYARVRDLFDRLPVAGLAHVILVTHGDTLRIAMAVLQGRDHREVTRDVVGNGEVLSVPWRAVAPHCARSGEEDEDQSPD